MNEVIVAAGESNDLLDRDAELGFEEFLDKYTLLGLDGVGLWACRRHNGTVSSACS